MKSTPPAITNQAPGLESFVVILKLTKIFETLLGLILLHLLGYLEN